MSQLFDKIGKPKIFTIMKHIIISFLFLTIATLNLTAQDSTAVSTTNATVGMQAIDAYNNSDYRKVIELLEKEKEEQKAKGLESSELYYNLGNAYFRVNDIAHARLNYERALLLDPGDRDIRHNIEYVTTKIEDKILVADTFFLGIWFRAVQSLFSSNVWAVTAVVCFILFIGCLVIFFFGRYMNIKKISFYAGIVLLVIIIFANIFSYNQKKSVEHRDTAVIMVGSASIYSSPDSNSKEITILHSGTKITVTKEDRNWLEIEMDNGSIGWIQRDKLEII